MARTHLIAEQVRRIESDPALTAHLTADSDATAAFGKAFGGASVVLGLTGIVAASVVLIDPTSPIAAVAILALIIFHLVLGWKVHILSRRPVDSFGDRGRAVSFGEVNVEKQGARASEAARVTEFTEETN